MVRGKGWGGERGGDRGEMVMRGKGWGVEGVASSPGPTF